MIMKRLFPSSVRARVMTSRLGSLLMLFQRTPIVQMLFPEAKIIGGAGIGELAKWSVATVAGLGAFDSVAGATTIAQISPTAGSNTVAAKQGQNLSFVFQLTNYPDKPGSWKVTGLPTGLTHADAKSNSIDSVSGIPTQSGTFSVKITAYANTTYSGDSFSKTFTMNVASNNPARITTDPSSVTINSGQTTTLTVVAAGATPLTYKWYRGNSGSTATPVGSNSASFTTPTLTANTSYWVRVSNADNPSGADSSTATVTVRQPAAITAHPQSVTINSGETATMSVTATGTAPLTYQWYQGSSGNTASPVGTNSSTFTSPALTAATSYWVKVTNTANPTGANSNTATVSLTQPAAITTHPQPKSIDYNTTATLNVTASGTSPLTYQWYQGASGDTAIPVGTNSATFTSPALTTSTSYWVKVTNAANPAGAASDAATVTVGSFVPISIVTQPAASVFIQRGNKATLNVTATGSVPRTYQWYQGPVGDTTTPVGTNSATFITPILAAETSYWVRVGNGGSTMDSDAAVVTPSLMDVEKPLGTKLKNGTSTLSYGNLKLGTQSAISITIRNSGDKDLTGITTAVSGLQASDYQVSTPLATTLAPDATTTFSVTFKPTAGGTRKTVLRILSDVPDEPPFTINLTGTCLLPVPEIGIQQPKGTNLIDGKTKRSFGTAKMQSKGKSTTFVITNTGDANLTGLSIVKTGNHPSDFIAKAPAKTTLAPGASTTFKVTFKPLATGTRKASLNIKSNDADENPFNISVTGLGTR